MQLPSHGSNPQHLYKAFGINPPEEIVDFSVNINPLGAPEAIKHNWGNWLADIYDYPDPTFTELKQTIAIKEGVGEPYLLSGNGASELITLIASYLQGKKVVIIHPAFSEYETACRSENCTIFHHVLHPPEWELDETSLERKLGLVDAVFFCHPNNPTGIQYDRPTVEWLIDTCQKKEVLLILDEAFYDFADPPVTFIDKASQSPFLLVLRSLTKMYSIAGLRLGYLAGHPEVLSQIRRRQAHWSINAIALKAGKTCLDDRQHVLLTRDYIKRERDRLFASFRETGFQHSPSAINFYLIRDPSSRNQQELFSFLLRRGLVLRHTYNFPGIEGKWLRVAIRKEAENSLLMEALSEWKREN